MTALPLKPIISLPQRHHEHVSIIQISDLHLFEDLEFDMGNLNYHDCLQKVIQAIKTHTHDDLSSIDLLAVTGDIVHEITPTTYDQVFAILDSLKVPYLCIAGNHDVTQELDPDLPFPQRRHLPMPVHPRLARCQRVSFPNWNLLFLDTSLAGSVYGRLNQESLDWLNNELATATRPCVIFAHHPMLKVNANWIDTHRLQNSQAFWEVVTHYPNTLKAIFVGHIHQEIHAIYQGTHLFSTPSTSGQFTPFEHDFNLDHEQQAGFRWITLYNNGNLATGIKRIDTM